MNELLLICPNRAGVLGFSGPYDGNNPPSLQAFSEEARLVPLEQAYIAPKLLDLLKMLSCRLRVDGRTADGISKEDAAILCDEAIAAAEPKETPEENLARGRETLDRAREAQRLEEALEDPPTAAGAIHQHLEAIGEMHSTCPHCAAHGISTPTEAGKVTKIDAGLTEPLTGTLCPECTRALPPTG